MHLNGYGSIIVLIRELIATVFLLLFSINARSEEDIFIRYSINANKPVRSLKSLSLGAIQKHEVLHTIFELGVLADGDAALFGQIGAGIEPKAGPIYFHFFQSIGFVTKEDQYLSGYFQFVEDLGVGIRDVKTQTALGFSFKHLSNGGLSSPNKGRELIGIQVRLPID